MEDCRIGLATTTNMVHNYDHGVANIKERVIIRKLQALSYKLEP